MKKVIIIFTIICSASNLAFSQSDFEKRKQEQQLAFDTQMAKHRQDFNAMKDSLNSRFASLLAQKWKSFELQQQKRDFKPMPSPPVFVPDNSKPDEPKPLPSKTVEPKPEPPVSPPITAQPKPDVPTVKTTFFGTTITVCKIQGNLPKMQGFDEKAVANYWTSLSKLDSKEWTNEILRVSSELKLNDWAIYLLINKLFFAYYPNGTENEQIVFSTFTLNQLGYRAKIGKTESELVQLLAFNNSIFNTMFFSSGNEIAVKYAVHNPKRKNLSWVQSCEVDYSGATKNLEMSLASQPKFANYVSTKNLNFENTNYSLQTNKNLVDFYETMPCTDFAVYGNAPLDKMFLAGIEAQLKHKIAGKSQEDAVNFLLHFTQYAFQYKTDDAQYGYEKWNFAEETLLSAYSDCDDRAIFFAQLVKNLLGMKVALLHYPQYHLAAAVKFDNQQLNGAYVMVDNSKYLVCDPTYIGANIGNAMPQLKNIPIEVVKLK